MEWLTGISLNNWLFIVAIVLGVIVIALSALIIIFRRLGKTDAAKKVEKVLFFVKTVKDLVLSAEGHENYSGKEKKDYVVAKAEAEFAKVGYDFSEEEISEEIEKNIEVANKVNRRGSPSRSH